MTTGVHVDVILTCFFSCKDRASDRYRPYQRKKIVNGLFGQSSEIDAEWWFEKFFVNLMKKENVFGTEIHL